MKHVRFLLGGVIGAGLMWLVGTTKGKKAQAKMTVMTEELFVNMKKTVLASPTWKEFEHSQYGRLVTQVVREYAKKHKLPKDIEAWISSHLLRRWKMFQRFLEGEKKKKSSSRS
jgi:hypothetical protein